MNAETAREDILSLPAGGAAIYDEALNLKQYRDDVDLLSGSFRQADRRGLS